MSIETDFSNYRTEKREEIQTMAKIITTVSDEFSNREKDLLLRSFIVLSYAYWESCYHRVQNVVFEKYKDVMIDNLPFALKNKVYLGFANDRAGSFKKKLIREINDYKVFQNITDSFKDTGTSLLSEYDDTILKKSLLDNRGNPTFDDLSKFMKIFNIRLENVVSNSISEGLLVPYILDFLSFIITQRNAIAHKNEKIQYRGQAYTTYIDCIDVVINDYSEQYGKEVSYDSPSLIKEMLFQIDRLFTILIETVEEKRRELENNDNDN